MFSWLVTGVDLQSLHADMPWLDTGVESTIDCSQICPGWIQVSNLELSSIDMPWLDKGIESGIGRLQMCPGWIQVSNLELVERLVEIAFLAGYRCRPLT